MKRAATILVALTLAVVALAGCGGGEEGASSATPAGFQQPDQAALAEMQECLAEQGVEMPEMTPPAAGEEPTGPPELNSETQEAFEECGGGPPPGPPPSTEG